MEIVRAEVGDAPALAGLHIRAWQEAYRNFLSRDYLESLDREKRTTSWQQILQAQGDREATFLLRKGAAEIVGFVDVGPERSGDLDVEGEINAIYLARGLYGTGAGARLMAKGADALLSFGITSASLWVFEENERARNFYEKLGGIAGDLRDDVLLDGEEHIEMPYVWRDLHALMASALAMAEEQSQ